MDREIEGRPLGHRRAEAVEEVGQRLRPLARHEERRGRHVPHDEQALLDAVHREPGLARAERVRVEDHLEMGREVRLRRRGFL
jgi:hypothetical protein